MHKDVTSERVISEQFNVVAGGVLGHQAPLVEEPAAGPIEIEPPFDHLLGTRFERIDLDGDGRDEIVGGNAYYRLNLIDDDGRRIISADRFGPEQTAVLAADGSRQVSRGRRVTVAGPANIG